MGLFDHIKSVFNGAVSLTRTPEAETRRLREEYAEVMDRVRRDLRAAERKVVLLEERNRILNDEYGNLSRERETLSNRNESIQRERDEIERRYKDLLETSLSDEPEDRAENLPLSTNSLEKSRLLKARMRPEDDNTNWLISYSDFITLMFAVFVMLFSLAATDVAKFKRFTNEIAGAFGGAVTSELTGMPVAGDRPASKPLEPMTTGLSELDVIRNNIIKTFRDYDLGESLFVDVKSTGVEVTLRENITFVSGDSALLESSREILGRLAVILEENMGYDIVVEGHTDNAPVRNGRFQTNWELSASRATNVARYFVEKKGLDSARFTAAGLGEYHPVADNSDEGGRAANRRVVIKLVSRRP